MKIQLRIKPVTTNTIYLWPKDKIKDAYIWHRHGDPTLVYSLKVRTK